MIIGIDGNEANVENRVGVNEYAFQLLWHLKKLKPEWKQDYRFVIYLKSAPKNLPKPSENWEYRVLPGSGMWILKTLMPHLWKSKNKPDLFFTPSHYVPPFAPMPRICSIMDLGYLEFSGQFRAYDFWQLKLWTAWSLFASKYIIAISNTTKKDIARRYRFTSNKIAVTPLGYDNSENIQKITPKDVRHVRKKYTIQSNYLLFLSTLKPSKNVEGLVRAWAKIEADFPSTDLVIGGKKGWLYEAVFDLVKKLKIKNRVVFTDFVAEEDKLPLISGARAFILPSFWEGFGLDVLTAQALGTPVVVSDRGSLPEVSGKVGLIVNPDDIDDMVDKIVQILKMPKSRYNKLVKKGKENAKKYSWEKTARETLKVFDKVK